jgi:D-cysteine desulfhydrase
MYKRAHANFSDLIHPPHAHLATTPTPVTLLKELNKESPVPISVKREDLTGSSLSGNEVRALEYMLHEARLQTNATTIISCGLAQGSQPRAISVAARHLGFGNVHLFLLGTPPPNNTGGNGNLFLSYMAGSKIHFLNSEQYEHREKLMNRLAKTLRNKGEIPYIIPEFFHQPSALWGYISMVKEMVDVQNRFPYTHVVLSVSSGLTLAGVLVARSMLKLRFHVIGFTVNDSTTAVTARIDRIIAQFNTQYGCNYTTGVYNLSDGYLGPGGSGVAYPEGVYWVQRLARLEGIFLDPIATGKAFYGLMDQAHKKAFNPTDHVLFIHTGSTLTLLENHHLFSFPHAAGTDAELLRIDNLEEEEEEDINKNNSFELDVEDDRENFSIQIIK